MKRSVRVGIKHHTKITDGKIGNNNIKQIIHLDRLNQIFIIDINDKPYTIQSQNSSFEIVNDVYEIYFTRDIVELVKILYLIGCNIIVSTDEKMITEYVIRDVIIT